MELLIVVACLAIVGLLALPAAGSNDVTRLRAAAQLLVADLQYAQLRSMGDSEDRSVVVFDLPASSYFLALASDTSTPITDPVTKNAYVTTFGSGRAHTLADVSIDALDVGGDDELAFTTLGALDQAGDANITLRCGSATLQITISATTGEATAN